MKGYAVRKGRKTGFFDTWEECRIQVSGYSGAEYKSFSSIEAAEQYMDAKPPAESAGVKAYVDGSYDHASGTFSCGAVILHDGKVLKLSEKSSDRSLAHMRNVAGEIMGAMKAMEYAVEHSIISITIFYDYAGIEKWCTGEWRTNKPGTAEYKRYYDSIKDVLQVSFVKVKGHSGDFYNDLADSLAKDALRSR